MIRVGSNPIDVICEQSLIQDGSVYDNKTNNNNNNKTKQITNNNKTNNNNNCI